MRKLGFRQGASERTHWSSLSALSGTLLKVMAGLADGFCGSIFPTSTKAGKSTWPAVAVSKVSRGSFWLEIA